MQVSGTWLVYTMTSDVNSIVFGVMVNAGQRHVARVQNNLGFTVRSDHGQFYLLRDREAMSI